MTQVTAVLARLPAVAIVVVGLALGPVVPAHGADPAADPVGGWPLRPAPEVVAPFDPPASPYAAGHRGVDLAGAVGQPVRAALPGRVSFAGSLAGRGVVVVDHGDTRTTYEPVTAGVGVGTLVRAGSRIGTLQLARSHCFPGACLHWGWIRGELYLDPLRLVGVLPVRLLPLGTGPPVAFAVSGAVTPRISTWLPPLTVAAAWRPSIRAGPGGQARGCACW